MKQQKKSSNRIAASTSLAICLCLLLVASLWLAVNPEASTARSGAQTMHSAATDWMKSPDNPVLQPGEQGQTVELRVSVNYAHDWAYVNADAHTTVTITVESADGAIYNAVGDTDNDGHLRSWELEWQPEHPDIQPGDTVIAANADETTTVDPVGQIAGTLDADADTVAGTIHAPWFAPDTLAVRCEIWEEDGPGPIEVEDVAADGGVYECDFSGIWDITPRGDVSVIYVEPDGDEVINVLSTPWMLVNYTHDWVGGNYQAGHTFDITIMDSSGNVKATAQITSEPGRGWGGDGFSPNEEDWTPMQPDIEPGDQVRFLSNDGYDNTIEVGQIAGTLDADADTAAGTIHAPWFAPDTLTVRCEIWEEDGPEPIKIEGVAADGGAYECNFSGIWDITAQSDVSVIYEEPDSDEVINILSAPSMRVNYGHDWVGGNYPVGHMFDITITDSSGSIKASAQITSEFGGGWDSDGFETQGEEDWTPTHPNIEPGDRVRFLSDDGYDNTIEVGQINGELDIDADNVSGTIQAAWLAPDTLTVRCEVWVEGGPEPIEIEGITADGGSYTCDFSGQWDIVPGQHIGVMYLEPDGDLVINVFEIATPDVWVEKWVEGSDQVMPGGPVIYTISYGNDNESEAVAETVILTDTLPADTAYVSDTSGVTPTIDDGNVVWMLGPLQPGEGAQFRLFLTNSAEAGDTLRNEVEIYTPNDRYEENNQAEAEAHVSDDQPDLYVYKFLDGHDPAPGQTFLYYIEYGNDEAVASGEVTLTDTLPEGTSVVSWSSGNGYDHWSEIDNDGEQLVLQAPSIPGHWGDELILRLLLDEGVEIDVELINTVEIVTENDAHPGNNTYTTHNNVNEPFSDGSIEKHFGHGQLVPGQELVYNLYFRNHGNTATHVWVTDTLPAGTTLVEARRELGSNEVPFPPDSVSGRSIAWDVGIMEPAESYNVSMRLRIEDDMAPGTLLTNCAEIAIDGNDSDPENDRVCVSDSVRSPGSNLRISKQVWWNDHDRQLEYHIDVENVGTVTLDQVAITDTYPISTTFSGDWWNRYWRDIDFEQDDANRQLVWTFETLEPNWRTGVGFQVDLNADIVGVQGLTFTNTVEVPITDDVYPGDNTATAIAYSGPDLFAEKWVSAGEILADERITFTMRYGNANQSPWGMSDETSARLTEHLPAGMTFIEARWPDGEEHTPFFEDPATGLIIWEEDQLGSDHRRRFYMVVALDDELEPGDVLTNTVDIAQVPETDIDPNPDNNTFLYPIKIPLLDLYLPIFLH